MPDTNTSLAKAANVGHLVILKDYADDTFATKDELQAATGATAEPTSSAQQMWNNHSIR